MLKVLDHEAEDNAETTEGAVPTLDEVAREGARRMLMAAMEDEVVRYIESHADARDENGRRLVVRNGHAQSRTVTCGAGTMKVRAPRVNDQRVDDDGERQRFTSRILPPYMRRSPQVAEVASAAVSARVVDGRLPRGASGAARKGRGGPESDEHRSADGGLGRGVPGVPAPGPVGV